MAQKIGPDSETRHGRGVGRAVSGTTHQACLAPAALVSGARTVPGNAFLDRPQAGGQAAKRDARGILPATPPAAAALSNSSFCLILATIASVFSLLLLGSFPNEDSLFASSLVLCLAGLLVTGVFAGAGWRPHVLALSFCGMYVAAYPTSGVLLRWFPETAHPMLDTSPETLAWSLLVGTAGWLSFVWGCCTDRRQVRPPADSVASSGAVRYHLTLPLWIGVIGICFRLLVQLYSFYESAGNFLNHGVLPSILANVGTICTCALWDSRLRAGRVSCLALLSAYSMAGLFSGQRADVFLPWFYLGGMMLLSAGRSPRQLRNGILFSAVLLALIVISYPVLTRFKQAMTKERVGVAGMTRAVEATAALGTVLDPYCDEAGADDGLGEAVLRISTRYSHLQYGGNLVVRGQETFGWLYGASLAHSVIVFIPRFIWPTKPTIGLGEQAYQLMGYQGAGSATVPIAVDWYLNFGLPGVVLGMFTIGRLYSVLGRHLYGRGPLMRAFSAFLVYPLMVAGQGMSGLVSVIVLHGLPVYVIHVLSQSAGESKRAGWRGQGR